MYIFIYIKLTKVVVDSVHRIGRCFPYRKYTQPCNSTSIPCTLFNRKLSILSARGNVSWIPPISKSPDLNNFNRIRVYAMRSFRCTYIFSIVSKELSAAIICPVFADTLKFYHQVFLLHWIPVCSKILNVQFTKTNFLWTWKMLIKFVILYK